jgi:hypothetical protein
VFLKEATSGLGRRVSYSIMDQTNSLVFTIPYELYDESTRSWRFNMPDLLSRFRALVLETQTGSRASQSPERSSGT